ncbi:antibiotic biosynthesis monooxygenase family protein [Halomonas sp. CUBES01]|uniref:Antibiotic biosynthesis monooxygenase n=1 Tax=Vreelandella gomseomensis TaxID=370766 RepID=A0ABU1GCI1_9GAMM|nr:MULTISPECIES: antibiotic biosynthesis monooxygenase family protein [Halomonas]MDR5874759.1 antibiotic biosynthesis monooxygenase [Halomonas gomseomensis]MEC4767730.1 antibiotic biosynthesis monooxygenase family protein [Halomonas sp. CUBES01]
MIKIIIERRIMPGLEEEYEQAAREAMRISLGARGFVTGESLVEMGHTDRRLMITKWRDLRAWNEWHGSEARASAMQRILPLLTEDETIRIYEASY